MIKHEESSQASVDGRFEVHSIIADMRTLEQLDRPIRVNIIQSHTPSRPVLVHNMRIPAFVLADGNLPTQQLQYCTLEEQIRVHKRDNLRLAGL